MKPRQSPTARSAVALIKMQSQSFDDVWTDVSVVCCSDCTEWPATKNLLLTHLMVLSQCGAACGAAGAQAAILGALNPEVALFQ